MRKIIQFSVLLLIANLVVTAVSAQLPKALAFSNVMYASPTSYPFNVISKYGVGYELGAGIGFGKTMLIGSVGRMTYDIDERSFGSGSGLIFDQTYHGKLNITPLKLGVRRYLLLGLFVNGNLGIAMRENSANYFLYEAGAGYKLGFFEVGAAYTGYSHSKNTPMNSFLFKAGLAIKI